MNFSIFLILLKIKLLKKKKVNKLKLFESQLFCGFFSLTYSSSLLYPKITINFLFLIFFSFSCSFFIILKTLINKNQIKLNKNFITFLNVYSLFLMSGFHKFIVFSYNRLLVNKCLKSCMKYLISKRIIDFLYSYYNNSLIFLLFFNSLFLLKKKLYFYIKHLNRFSLKRFIFSINILLNEYKKVWGYTFGILFAKNDNSLLLLNQWILVKQFYYINYNFSKKPLSWKIEKFFGPFNPYNNDFWIFGDSFSSIFIIKFDNNLNF